LDVRDWNSGRRLGERLKRFVEWGSSICERGTWGPKFSGWGMWIALECDGGVWGCAYLDRLVISYIEFMFSMGSKMFEIFGLLTKF
jgi:hypothetical protein